MNTTVEKLEGNRIRLTVSHSATEVNEAVVAAYTRVARQIKLPGFRPGKAPRPLIDTHVGRESVLAEALEELVESSYPRALDELRIRPISAPDTGDLDLIEEGVDYTYTAEVEVRPDYTVSSIEDLKAEVPPADSTDAEIDAQIEYLRDRFDKYLYEVGRGIMPPEFETGLLGAKAGDKLHVEFAVPETAANPDYVGKPAAFDIEVHEVKSKTLPALDDEFARLALTPREGEVPEGANLVMLREKVAESLKREKEQAMRETRRRAVLDGLLALHEVPAPETMVESEVDSALKEYARHLTREGVDLKDARVDWNELRKEARPSAERRVKEYLLLDAIGDKENVTVTDTELDAEMKRRAQAMGLSFGDLKSALVKANRIEGVREELRIDRVLDFLLAEAAVAL